MMFDNKQFTELQLLLLITNPSAAKKVEKLYKQANILMQYRFKGEGTAQSYIMDYLGLEDVEKVIYINILPKVFIKKFINKLYNMLLLHEPGNGIAFTLPLDGVSSPVMKLLDTQIKEQIEKMTIREVEKVAEKSNYSLILTIVNQGFSEEVMNTARAAGATGGTVIHARHLGTDEAMQFWGICIQKEREMIFILTKKETKKDIMRAIGEKHGSNSEANGITISLPVGEVVGIGEEENL